VNNNVQLVPLDQLGPAVLGALTNAGLPSDEAKTVGACFVDASLRGVDTHGVNMLPEYLDRIRARGWVIPSRARVVERRGATALVDGGAGLGQMAASLAMDVATKLAADHGVGLVGVRNSSHFGAVGYFARMATDRGMIGMVFTNASPAMAPEGGAERLLSNNPWAIAVPTADVCPLVLDIANSVVARSRIRQAAQAGESIPSTWAVNPAGQPTTDPREALRGSLLPMGGHKGYGIALMVDVLSGILTGSSYGSEVGAPFQIALDERPDGEVPEYAPQGVGHLVIAIDASLFRPVEDFKEEVSRMAGRLRESRPAIGRGAVMVPGDPECLTERVRRKEGIPVRRQAWEVILVSQRRLPRAVQHEGEHQ
jgi:LDH2 family malate/lactate/ureidoglycolate dehydrogenase